MIHKCMNCLRYTPRSITAGHRVYLFSTFPKKAKLFSKVIVTLVFLKLVLVSYIFLKICPLHPQFPIYWA